MMKRQPLQAFKVYRKGYIMEVAIYQVPVSAKTPQGYRFRCFLVDPVSGEELVGYDNHWPKGSHRHFRGTEEPYAFQTLEKLLHAFEQDCARLLKEEGDNEDS